MENREPRATVLESSSVVSKGPSSAPPGGRCRHSRFFSLLKWVETTAFENSRMCGFFRDGTPAAQTLATATAPITHRSGPSDHRRPPGSRRHAGGTRSIDFDKSSPLPSRSQAEVHNEFHYSPLAKPGQRIRRLAVHGDGLAMGCDAIAIGDMTFIRLVLLSCRTRRHTRNRSRCGVNRFGWDGSKCRQSIFHEGDPGNGLIDRLKP